MSDTETATFFERSACINCGGTRLRELAAGRFDQGPVQRFIDEDPWGEHPAPFLRGKPWSYVACQDCGMAFHRYLLTPEWNERRFARWMSQEAIEVFEKPFRTPVNQFRQGAELTRHVLRLERLTRAIRGAEALRVLDFGCGYGHFLAMCSLYGFAAYGVDRSAAKREHGHFAGIFPEIEDVASFAPFHVLTLFEVLEHLDDPRAMLERLGELLMPGGILVLETPDCSGVRGINTREDYARIHPLEHINGFTPETLEDFARRLGFARIARPVSYVAGDAKTVAKTAVKGLLDRVRKGTTQMYFRKPQATP